MLFCITFPIIHFFSDNWIEVESSNELTARQWAEKNFPRKWASVYPKENFHAEYFPGGKIGLTVLIDIICPDHGLAEPCISCAKIQKEYQEASQPTFNGPFGQNMGD